MGCGWRLTALTLKSKRLTFGSNLRISKGIHPCGEMRSAPKSTIWALYLKFMRSLAGISYRQARSQGENGNSGVATGWSARELGTRNGKNIIYLTRTATGQVGLSYSSIVMLRPMSQVLPYFGYRACPWGGQIHAGNDAAETLRAWLAGPRNGWERHESTVRRGKIDLLIIKTNWE